MTYKESPLSKKRKKAFLYHGILGSKKNMLTFSKELARSNPSWDCLALDLRNHGDGAKEDNFNDLSHCAQDIVHTSTELGPAQMLIGHSFSGKVVLEYARFFAHQELKTVWILDTIPVPISTFPKNAPADFSVLQILSLLEQIALPIPSRQWLLNFLLSHEVPNFVASWLTTCLKRVNDHLVWNFQIGKIRPMLESYAQADYAEYLANTEQNINFHFVQAAQSTRWSAGVLAQMSQICQKNPRVQLHVLENAGHFVHSDNLSGLLDLMHPSFCEL